MSAECWVFCVDQQTPFWPNRSMSIVIGYFGPHWEDDLNLPSSNLRLIRQHLGIVGIYGLNDWLDEEANTNNFYSDLIESIKDYSNRYRKEIIDIIIKSFEETNTKPIWYWDT